jgi:hypothetical protein
MDFRCPKCNSTDLKKVSVAYEEGLFRSNARTRIRGVLVGSGGPDVVVGSATTKGTHQTALSKRLSPPKKWSYLKLVVGFGAVSFIALVVYVHSVMSSPSTGSSLPVQLYGLIASCAFVFLVLLARRHNHFKYAQELQQWDRSYVCARCGAVSEHGPRSLE